jgi:hypothetical protein
MTSLNTFEVDYEKCFQGIAGDKRQKAGALLPIIPPRERWEHFLSSIRTEWNIWRRDLTKYPKCLIVLYGGLAFYEYDENTFWPQFYKAVGSDQLPANQQTDINNAFSKVAEQLGLKIQQRSKGTAFVSSAVYHIGIPLSLWDGFIDICEWALWREDWEVLTDEEWAESVEKRAGGRKRLKRFLIDNREAATTFVKEILDARQILTNNPNYTIADLKQACFLRPEYFDEVPETAEFLRPENPESLFQDRARLICDLQRRCISVQLPAVKRDKLPAIWIVGTCTQKAAATPDELVLNSQAFDSALYIKLKSETKEEIQRLLGIKPWGMIDLERGAFINANRQQLPLRSYAIISPEKLEISRKGFDEEENPVNESFELSDGAICFVTRLWPNGKYAELLVKNISDESKISFRTKSNIEARFYVGKRNHAANYKMLEDGRIQTDTLPALCLSIPCGYFSDSITALSRFQVLMDGKPAGGTWKNLVIQDGDDRDYYTWEGWRFIEKKEARVLRDFRELGDCYKSPDLKGDHVFSIKSPEFRIDYKLSIDHSKTEIKNCWEKLPGAFLLWFLLCQPTQENKGLKFDDLLLAKDIIEPNEFLLWKLLGKYAKKGFFILKGRHWMIAESRAVLNEADNKCLLQYCGNPSILWELYREINVRNLPIVEVIDKKRELPYLQMSWESYLKGKIERYLIKKGVHIGETLWTH